MKKRLLSILMALALCLSLLPAVALAATAATDVTYRDASGASKTCASATVVESGDTAWGDDGNNGWYVVNTDVTIDSRISVSGTVHLILADGCTLTANKGIQVPSNKSLTIYAQAGGTGKLIANDGSSPYPDMSTWVAAIGGNSDDSGNVLYSGKITINGGIVEATATYGAAIGGGFGIKIGGFGGTTTINGGSVKAKSEYGAGIGGGACSAPAINAQNGTSGGSGGTVIINGGSVEAESQYGAGIGGAYGGHSGGSGGSITINGGTVNAKSTQAGAGIGGGGGYSNSGSGGTVTISGGTVTATGADGASGIGAGKNSGNNGTFQTTATGNAFINASSIGDKSKQSSWNCIFFDDISYTVYGDQTLANDMIISEEQELIIPKDSTLTIPQGITLINNGTITNSGKLYVGGTVKEKTYYLLTVNGGTFTSSETQTNNGKTYARAGSTITLTPNASPTGQAFDHWEISGASISGNSFTMPAGPVTVTAKYASPLTITAQPTGGTITYGQTITLSVAAGSAAGTLTYQWYEGSTAISGADSASYTTPTTLAAGNHTYSCKVTCGSNTVTSSTATVTVNPLAEAAPNISIDYENETLTGFVSGSSYTINSTAVTPVNGKLSVTDYLGRNISIVTTARDGNYAASAAQTLNIPARPAMPSPVGANETVKGKNDGKITGLNAGTVYQISRDNGATWQDKTADSYGRITGLAPAAYKVRVKATSTSFASLAAAVTIATGDERTYTLNVTAPTFAVVAYGYTRPTVKAIIITSSGNWQSTITDVTVDSTDFTIGGSGSTVAAGGYINTRTVQPASGLAAGSYTATITVTYDNGVTATAPVSFTVTKAAQNVPAAPTVKSKTYNSVTLEEIPDNANGARAQYSMDGGTTWQDSPEFTGLSANTEYSFIVRFGETDNYRASTAGAELKVTTNAATSGGGSGSVTYPPTVEQPEEGGSVTTSTGNPTAGDTVTITPKADEGYEVDEILVTDQNGNPVEVTDNGDGTYSFTQPSGKVTIRVVFGEAAAIPFVDVPAHAYYYDAVLWAAENGITEGVDETHFAPDATCTRAQIVTFLWRAAGCPEPESLSSFADVPADSYYAKAVAWAVEQGITVGTGDEKFSPDAPCTRAQCVAFLWRAQGTPDANASNPFIDVAEGTFYTDAVLWAAENGITLGTNAEGTTFSPDGDCTRAQIVTFLYRCLGE